MASSFRRSRRGWYLVLGLVLALFVVGCGGSSDDDGNGGGSDTQAETTSEKASGDLKLAVVLPGKIDDGSWNTDGYEGLLAAGEALGAETAYVENVGPANQEQALRNYGSQEFDVVFAHGGQYETAVEAVAPSFPDTQFVTISGVGAGTPPNINVYTVDFTMGAYVQGLMNGMLSETKKTGMVAALQGLQNVNEVVSGYRAGVKAADESATTTVVYLKNNEDPSEAKAAAQAIVSDDVDALGVGALNAAQQGVIQVAKSSDSWLGTQYADFTADAGKQITTTQLYTFGTMYTLAAQAFADGKLNGISERFGFADGPDTPGTQLFYDEQNKFNPDLPQEVLDAAEKAVEDLESGAIKVDVTAEAAAPGTK